MVRRFDSRPAGSIPDFDFERRLADGDRALVGLLTIFLDCHAVGTGDDAKLLRSRTAHREGRDGFSICTGDRDAAGITSAVMRTKGQERATARDDDEVRRSNLDHVDDESVTRPIAVRLA
jgi:hypothetical protein